MAEKKTLGYHARTWVEALEKLRTFGIADVYTGAPQTAEWNEKVARRLTMETGLNIVLTGPSLVDGELSNTTFRYMVEVNNNRDAAMLLSKTDD